MFLLLKKLKINENIAFIAGLIFAFTPFISHRVIGHYTYIPIYFFPLTYLLLILITEKGERVNKYAISVLSGFFLSFVLLSNFYYFLMILLSIIFYLTYYFVFDKKTLFIFLHKNTRLFSVVFMSAAVSFLPWFFSVIQFLKEKQIYLKPGLGSAITLSADILSFFTPSFYNPVYKNIFSFLSLNIPYFAKFNYFFINSWERFVYPGILIIVIYTLIIFSKYFLKQFPEKLWKKIKLYFYASIFFAVLMMGPFIKIFNRWSINLDGVSVVFPLPFLLLRYVPGLSDLRAPSRFAPAFVFFACIVVSIVLNYLLIKKIKNEGFRTIFIVILFFIFALDQNYVIPTKLNKEIPVKIYEYLETKPMATVLEIPFTVRDGLQYLGFVHAIQPMIGQVIHKKPIIGGYMARVPKKIFNFYENKKFISYLASLIDKGNYNPFLENPENVTPYSYPYDTKEIKMELNTMNIKYILLKNNEIYTGTVKNYIVEAGYRLTKNDAEYYLFELL